MEAPGRRDVQLERAGRDAHDARPGAAVPVRRLGDRRGRVALLAEPQLEGQLQVQAFECLFDLLVQLNRD